MEKMKKRRKSGGVDTYDWDVIDERKRVSQPLRKALNGMRRWEGRSAEALMRSLENMRQGFPIKHAEALRIANALGKNAELDDGDYQDTHDWAMWQYELIRDLPGWDYPPKPWDAKQPAWKYPEYAEKKSDTG